jgi:hypothetical protein
MYISIDEHTQSHTNKIRNFYSEGLSIYKLQKLPFDPTYTARTKQQPKDQGSKRPTEAEQTSSSSLDIF